MLMSRTGVYADLTNNDEIYLSALSPFECNCIALLMQENLMAGRAIVGTHNTRTVSVVGEKRACARVHKSKAGITTPCHARDRSNTPNVREER